MCYRIEIENSTSGSRVLEDLFSAELLYKAAVKGLEISHDVKTNVRLLKRKVTGDGWDLLKERFLRAK